MALISNAESGSSVRTKLNAGVTYTTTTQVSSAQIKTLFSSPTIVIPAPGAGKAVLMAWMSAHYIYGTVPYTTGGNSTLVFGYDQTSVNNAALGDFGDFLIETEDCVSFASNAQESSSFLPVADVENNPLYILVGGQDLVDGDGTLSVTAHYFIVDV